MKFSPLPQIPYNNNNNNNNQESQNVLKTRIRIIEWFSLSLEIFANQTNKNLDMEILKNGDFMKYLWQMERKIERIDGHENAET